ncbi:MAG: dihydrofolate reductase family protein [Candidatus Altiarchaeota archaeon]
MQPHVILNSAMSLDGRIGRKGQQFVFSNRLDNYRVHELRGSVDAVMVDVETIIKDNPLLSAPSGEKKPPVKVVVDKSCEIPLDAKVFEGDDRVIVVVSSTAPKGRSERLEKLREGVEVLPSGRAAVNLENLLWTLYERGIRRILLEGGSSLNRRMLDDGLVNEIYLTVAPTLLGEGISFFESKEKVKIDLTLEGILQFGDQVVLHYRVK